MEYEKSEVSMGFKKWMKVCEDKTKVTYAITLNYVVPLRVHTHTHVCTIQFLAQNQIWLISKFENFV